MAGNSLGHIFRVSTFGESHGPAIGVVIDGVVPGIKLREADIQVELNRRRPGQSSITTKRKESDKAEILSGVFEGKTTGTPIALLIRNKGARPYDYSKLKNVFRPGHADYTYFAKYGIRDHRGGGRASGRETAARVAAGAVAKKILSQHGIKIAAYTLAVGDICAERVNLKAIESNPIRCPDARQAKKMVKLIQRVQKSGDSLGGIVEAIVAGCPAGLGDPVFDKLNARLAHAVMSIGAVRGIEIGAGFASALLTGSQVNDVLCRKGSRIGTKTNHAGGIMGGISTGEEIVLRAAIRAPSSVSRPQETITKNKKKTTIKIAGRHDPCLCPRIIPVVEAMIAIVLVDCIMLQEVINAQKKSR